MKRSTIILIIVLASIGLFFWSRYGRAQNIAFDEVKVTDLNGEYAMLSSLVKGPTIVHFYASWCGPCKGEMPSSQALREEYAAKGVNFVYISLDEDKADWASANKNFALPDGHSFVLPNPSGSEITARFNISSIPRYVLMDANGNVVDDNAPRPSETTRIKESLNKMLK